MSTISLLPLAGFAQTNSNQNLVRNGDFSNGLFDWTFGTLKPSEFSGYPKSGTFPTPGRIGSSAYLDVAGGAAAYLESDPFVLGDKVPGWTLNFTFFGTPVILWGASSSAMLEVQLTSQAGIYTLDSLKPPVLQLGQQPAMRHYLIPANFTDHYVALRLACTDTPPTHANGVFCTFGDVGVLPAQPGPIQATTDITPIALIFIALGLVVAAAAVALAYASSSNAQGHAKLGFHGFLASLALAFVGYVSKKFCCACAGACNHKGPHSFCPAHDPTTLHSRMEIVYKVYCRHCGRKLEEHECKGPAIEAASAPRGNPGDRHEQVGAR